MRKSSSSAGVMNDWGGTSEVSMCIGTKCESMWLIWMMVSGVEVDPVVASVAISAGFKM